MRDYGTGTWEGGDPDCAHTVGGQVEDNKAPGAITTGQRPGVDASTCRECGAQRVDKQIGLEPTPELFVERMVEVFREVRRVLRDDGTCFIVIGDSYAASRSYQVSDTKHKVHDYGKASAQGIPPGLKPKDLVMIPARLALGLQADGWWLRSDIIWAKGVSFLDSWSGSVMPEAVRDRPSTSHEHVLLLTKSASYFWDAEAIREKAAWDRWGTQTTPKYEGTDSKTGWMQEKGRDELPTENGRNARSVWAIPTEPQSFALCSECNTFWESGGPREHCGVPTVGHFATMPTALCAKAISAGCPAEVCRVCGKARVRIVERDGACHPLLDCLSTKQMPSAQIAPRSDGGLVQHAPGSLLPEARETTFAGWTDCGHGDFRPGVVLDPFAGSGTTILTARLFGRHAVGVELNADYVRLMEHRLSQLSLLA